MQPLASAHALRHSCTPRRGDYGTFKLYSGSAAKEELGTKLWKYLLDLHGRQGLYVVPVLALLGLCVSLKKVLDSTSRVESPGPVTIEGGKQTKTSRQQPEQQQQEEEGGNSELSVAPLALLSAYVFYMGVFHVLSNLPLVDLFYGVVARFWMQPNIIVFIWAGMGIDWLVDAVAAGLKGRVRSLVVMCFYAACAALVGVQLQRNYGLSDQSQARYFNQYARSLLEPLPRGAVLLLSYDMQWTSVRYMQVRAGVWC